MAAAVRQRRPFMTPESSLRRGRSPQGRALKFLLDVFQGGAGLPDAAAGGLIFLIRREPFRDPGSARQPALDEAADCIGARSDTVGGDPGVNLLISGGGARSPMGLCRLRPRFIFLGLSDINLANDFRLT